MSSVKHRCRYCAILLCCWRDGAAALRGFGSLARRRRRHLEPRRVRPSTWTAETAPEPSQKTSSSHLYPSSKHTEHLLILAQQSRSLIVLACFGCCRYAYSSSHPRPTSPWPGFACTRCSIQLVRPGVSTATTPSLPPHLPGLVPVCALRPLVKGGELPAEVLGILSSSLFALRAEVAKLLSLSEPFRRYVSRERRQAVLETLDRDLFADRGFARGVGRDGDGFLFALWHRDGANVLSSYL